MESKKRCNNFTYDEVEVLVGLVEKNRDIVESKKTDHLSCSEKDKIWKKMETNFNSICGTGRNNKMLRSKWESLKKTTKQLHGQVKCELYKTGGGPQSTVELKGVSSRVMSIIGIGATGLDSAFDSDAHNDIDLTTECSDPAASSVVDTFEKEEEKSASEWASWNPNLLKTPVHKALRTSDRIDDETADIPVPGTSKIETNQKQIEIRKKRRQRREKEEKRREKRIEAEENRKMGNYPTPILHLESILQFPEFGTDIRLRTESESTLPSERSLSPDLACSLEFSSSTCPSFATMLATEKKQSPSWPILKATSSPLIPQKLINITGSKMSSTSTKEMVVSDAEVDPEDYKPVPSFNASFGDVIAQALQKAAGTDDAIEVLYDCEVR